VNATIRRAGPGDERALAELNAFVHALHLAHDPSYFRPVAADEVAAWYRGLMEKPAVRFWLAEDAGAPVGYAAVWQHERAENPFCRARRWWEIDQIGVRPDRQRGGVGRALVEQVLAAARAEGIDQVELVSWCFNADAQAAFRELGFSPKLIRFARSSGA
jgi:ribosomal protein S18 acetylase RimI-like enzyme